MTMEEGIDQIENLRDDDQISNFEEGFMRGYESELDDY